MNMILKQASSAYTHAPEQDSVVLVLEDLCLSFLNDSKEETFKSQESCFHLWL